MNLREAYDLNKAIEAFVMAKTTPYTPDDLAYINQYTGFGGMWKFDDNLKGNRGLYEYYTDWAVVEKMIGLAIKYGYKQGQAVLEPSCGIGRFLHYFSPQTPVIAYEPDEVSASIAKANFPGYDIKKQTFNELFTDRSGKLKPIKAEYHLVIGNPPYGAFTGRLTAQEKGRTGAKTYPEYFIRRSADILLSGGLIVFIIPSTWLDSNQDVPNLELLEAYRMPVSTFSGQTDVATDIVIYRKN
jgi:hypothetical protein